MEIINIEHFLNRVISPSRYTGGEFNSIKKNWETAPVRMAMIYPDLYEIGMSNSGHLLLYYLINETTPYLIERSYAPYFDMEEILRKEKIPLFSLESRQPLNKFDIIGFSLQYELTFTNVLNILDLGGIPLLQKDRGENDPLIIGGGPVASYAESMAPFFDLFFVGEAEEGLLEILNKVAQHKLKQTSRKDILLELCSIEGVYVPSLYEEKYNQEGVSLGLEPVNGYSGIPRIINRRIIKDLECAYYPLKQMVPFKAPIHDRAVVELFRGCFRGCRFCLAGYLYRPVRFRSLPLLQEQSSRIIENTGFETLGLTSFNSSDYPYLKELILFLKKTYGDKLTLSLPSLSMRTSSVELACISDKRRTNLTFAPEAATERLRKVINKNLPEEEIFNTVKETAKQGMDLLKLYFMIGLPTEREEDVQAIVPLVKELHKTANAHRTSKRPFHFNITVSPFVPKPHTPFEREKQLSIKDCYEKIGYLKSQLHEPLFTLREHDPLMSFLEGVFGRGDRNLHRVIFSAFQKGARFDGWEEHLKINYYQQAFTEEEIDPLCYLEEKEGPLPWEMINCGLSPELLKRERDKAFREEESDASLFTDI